MKILIIALVVFASAIGEAKKRPELSFEPSSFIQVVHARHCERSSENVAVCKSAILRFRAMQIGIAGSPLRLIATDGFLQFDPRSCREYNPANLTWECRNVEFGTLAVIGRTGAVAQSLPK